MHQILVCCRIYDGCQNVLFHAARDFLPLAGKDHLGPMLS
ncbi:hypothetical protein CAter282_2273 [Collimonas arenae]|uniref:Uncharacterized protein n=1 Tax=Collimonas arenae TaxID=279058 RepID=A0A127QJ04_9BURK|nr:hypothetical protein CAter10_2475 [Collimonas arenae]AMP10023.1 hypothetical protein CAter282_2273 [Collimonas arenae]